VPRHRGRPSHPASVAPPAAVPEAPATGGEQPRRVVLSGRQEG
jgi:hypothetical protein